MDRRELIKLLAFSGALMMKPFRGFSGNLLLDQSFTKDDFGKFKWGVTTTACQVEGAANKYGKGESIWDHFSHKKGNIKDNSNPDVACDFYHSYKNDTALIKDLGFDVHRFSIAWSRVFPDGKGSLNKEGVDFYHRVIDTCLENGIEPWITLYHWDLPQKLEDEGGWTSRDIIGHFSDYTDFCSRTYGDKVKNWIVLNEPLGYTALGYMTGYHAPGRKGLKNFLPAVHHSAMCQAEGGRILKANIKDGHIGTAFSCSHVDPAKYNHLDEGAVKRLDALFNRLFIEPLMGMGYPIKDLHLLRKIENYIQPGDMEKLKFDFDFIGLQNYFRIVGRYSLFPPLLWANVVSPDKRQVETTEMDWEVFPEGIYEIIKQFSNYPIKEIVITENGAAFEDIIQDGSVHDEKRVKFFKDYLTQVLRAKRDGYNITGYLVWSIMDTFEWTEGYKPRFGIAYTDYNTQQRIIKDSGYWFRDFLKK